ncbi:MAG: hypothetical protein AAF184_22395 [Pseudomonadota bacterium]
MVAVRHALFASLALSAVGVAHGLEMRGTGTPGEDVFIERVVTVPGALEDLSPVEWNALVRAELDALLGEDHGLEVNFIAAGKEADQVYAGLTATSPIYFTGDDATLLVISVSLVPEGEPAVLAHESGHRAHDKRLLEDLPMRSFAGRALTGRERAECLILWSDAAVDAYHARVGSDLGEAEELMQRSLGVDAENEALMRTVAARAAATTRRLTPCPGVWE